MKLNKHQLIILGSIVFFGGLLRLWNLENYPVGFTADEASQGYTAYSLLETGKDEWGISWPLNPRSFGDFKPPLQTYLIIPSIALFGLNQFAVRLPNALLGSLAIVGVYLLATKFFQNKKIGLLSAGILAFSPWHWILSRVAVEANLTVFFISFGLYFLMTKNQIPAAIFLGLNMFSYHSAKIFTPLVIILFSIYYLKFGTKDVKNHFVTHSKFYILYSIFLVVAFSSFFIGGDIRGLDVAIFNPTDQWQVVNDFQWWGFNQDLPINLSRLLHNKPIYTLSIFFENYLSYFSPSFLFLNGPSDATYGMVPGFGVIWWWLLPILLFGLYTFIKQSNQLNSPIGLLILIIVLAPIPAALTKGLRMANRAAVMMPFIQMFSAWSIYMLFDFIKFKKFKVLFLTALISVISFSFLYFSEVYFVQSPRLVADSMLYGRCQAVNYVEENYPQAEKVVMSRSLSEPQSFVMFCQEYSPALVQEESGDWLRYQDEGFSFLDQLGEYSLGKYVFRDMSWERDSRHPNTVIIGRPEEFHHQLEPDKIINYPDEKAAINIYKI